MSNLFEQAQSLNNSKKSLYEFKAGKMTKEGTLVTPDERKGKVILTKDDSLLHFQWVLRDGTNKVIDDFIVFPEEATFKKVDKVTKSNVFYLDFQASKQVFYWLQEFKDEKEVEELVNKVNGLLQAKDQQQSETMNQLSGSSGNKPEAKKGTVGEDALKNALSSIPSQGTKTSNIGLSSVLNPDHVCSVIQKNPDLVNELIKYLPEGTKSNVADVCDHIRSAQFKQTVRTIEVALHNGQLSGFMQSLGLDPNLGLLGGTEPFLKALQDKEDEDKKEEKKDKMEEE
eukprot:gene1439-12058_t